MIKVRHVKQNRIRPISSKIAAEIGDSILISGSEEDVPFVPTKRTKKLHILLISPIGSIVDSDQVDLDETGLRRIYTFPITPDLYSGTYFLQIDGDYKLREKINIRTNKHLMHRWLFHYGVQVSNPNSFPINNVVVDIVLPPNITPIQHVTKVECSHAPSKLVTDQEGNRWLRYYFHQLNPNENFIIAYRAHLITRLVAYDVTRIRGEEEYSGDLFTETYNKYTKAEPYLDSNHEEIVKIARKYQSYSPLSKVLAFLKYVKDNLIFVPQDGDYGAAFAIENGVGDCTEFASLFVSICRAANIPSRLTTSVILSELEGWVSHAQAEFFINGIWIPIDPTLQHDFRYLYRNPSCILLQRGNTLGDSNIREVRYSYDDIGTKNINIHAHKEVNWDKTYAIGKKGDKIPTVVAHKEGSFFENVSWKFVFPSLELKNVDYTIEIKITAPETAPRHKPFSIPVHLYNRNEEEIIGTIRVSFARGGVYTSHLYPLKLPPNSHEPKMIEIPATNFLGITFIDIIFQDENGNQIGYEQKKINFH